MDIECDTASLEHLAQDALGPLPHRRVADGAFRSRAEVNTALGEAEEIIRTKEHLDDARHLGVDLLGGAEDVRVVLRERSDARQPGGDTRALVAMEPPEVGDAQR